MDGLLGVKGVVDVREPLTGRWNIIVEVEGTSTRDITRITDAIHDLGLEIDRSELLKRRLVQSFDHFHYEGHLVGEDVAGDGGR